MRARACSETGVNFKIFVSIDMQSRIYEYDINFVLFFVLDSHLDLPCVLILHCRLSTKCFMCLDCWKIRKKNGNFTEQ